jgi:alpha-beta hydrolase superfamily lysophospholipase
MKGMAYLLLPLMLGCTNVFFQPTREKYFDPKKFSGSEPRDLHFESSTGNRLHAWLFKARKRPPRDVTVVQFHGNAENMTSHFASVVWLLDEGFDLFTFDYRGYGESEGAPYPAGVLADSLAALDQAWEAAGKRERSLIVYGQSLGGAVALKALEVWPHREAVRDIVIESSFLSYQRMAREKLAGLWFTWPFQWLAYLLVSDGQSPAEELGKLSPIPILVMHGGKDEVVPFHHGEEIYRRAGAPKCFLTVPDGEHIQLLATPNGIYRKAFLTFIDTGKCAD